MTGIICMWHGLIVDIPDGWALCDGTNGTPDLRNRFVRGAAFETEPGGTGGSVTHRHTVSGNTSWDDTEHTHQIEGYTGSPGSGLYEFTYQYDGYEQYEVHTHYIDLESDVGGSYHRHTFFDFSTNTSTNPLYYDILFIMKT